MKPPLRSDEMRAALPIENCDDRAERSRQHSSRDYLDVIGDRWTFLILYSACEGALNFEDFCSKLGIARNVLASRLRILVAAEILDRQPVERDARKIEYRLTEKGKALQPTLNAMELWAGLWCQPSRAARAEKSEPCASIRFFRRTEREI